MNEEIWKPIEGYEEYYEISSLGRVRSFDRVVTEKNGKTRLHRGRELKQAKAGRGYPKVELCCGDKSGPFFVHRLVAGHFVDNPDDKPCVNHKDRDKTNNKAENLEWVTYSENTRHMFETGYNSNPLKGSDCHSARLNEKIVYEIRCKYQPGTALELADEYGITRASIYHITSGRTWAHVPFPPDYPHAIRPRKR